MFLCDFDGFYLSIYIIFRIIWVGKLLYVYVKRATASIFSTSGIQRYDKNYSHGKLGQMDKL